LVKREFRPRRGFSVPHPLLLASVSDIIGLCAQPQVLRTNTSRTIAMMEDTHAIWNRAKMKHPGNPRRFYRSCLAYSHSAISSVSQASGPQPTRSQIRAMCWHGSIFVHIAPKPGNGSERKSLRGEEVRRNLDHVRYAAPVWLLADRGRYFNKTTIFRECPQKSHN